LFERALKKLRSRTLPLNLAVQGSVYAHFKNKEDLFIALLETRVRSRIEFTRESLAGLSPQQQRAWLARFYETLLLRRIWYILSARIKNCLRCAIRLKSRVKALYKLLSADVAQLFLDACMGDKKNVDFAAAVIREFRVHLFL